VFDPDPLLRRLERRAILFCLGASVVSLVVRGGDPDVALGVLAGGLLAGISYWAIRTSVTGIVALVTKAAAGRSAPADAASAGPAMAAEDVAAPASPLDPVVPGEAESRPKKGAIVLRLAGRYLLLGLLAYGMIARLRLHPVGLLIGVSSLFAAASLEALAGPRRRP
jgi:hypothetical protein